MARKQKRDPFLFFVVLLVLFLLFGLPLLKDQKSVSQLFTSSESQPVQAVKPTVPLEQSEKPILTARSKLEKPHSGRASRIPAWMSKSETATVSAQVQRKKSIASRGPNEKAGVDKKSAEPILPEEQGAKFTDAILVAKVIDGDTIELADGRHVRLIGIDTPESRKNEKAKRDSLRSQTDLDAIVKMGLKAKKALTDLVANRMVNLEYDVTKKDKYGRTLAYIYLIQPADDMAYLPFEKVYQNKNKQIFVNATMVQNGFAQPMTYPPNVKYADIFKKLFEEAHQHKRGLWEEKEILVKEGPEILF